MGEGVRPFRLPLGYGPVVYTKNATNLEFDKFLRRVHVPFALQRRLSTSGRSLCNPSRFSGCKTSKLVQPVWVCCSTNRSEAHQFLYRAQCSHSRAGLSMLLWATVGFLHRRSTAFCQDCRALWIFMPPRTDWQAESLRFYILVFRSFVIKLMNAMFWKQTNQFVTLMQIGTRVPGYWAWNDQLRGVQKVICQGHRFRALVEASCLNPLGRRSFSSSI